MANPMQRVALALTLMLCAAMGSIALVTTSLYAGVVPLAEPMYAGPEQTDSRLVYVGAGESGGFLAIDIHAEFQVARPYEYAGYGQTPPGEYIALNWNNCGRFMWSFGRFGNDGPTAEYPVFEESLSGSPAVTFDGGDKMRMITEANALLPAEITDGVLTVEMWVRNPTVEAGEVLVRFEDTSDLDITEDQFNMTGSTNWQHLVAVSSGGQITYYKNNVQVGAPQAGALAFGTSGIINLGATNFSGSIAAFRIHTEAMDAADIAHNYNGGVMLGTYLFWPINEDTLESINYGDPRQFPDRDWRESEHWLSAWIPSEDPSLVTGPPFDDIPFRVETVELPNAERYYRYTMAQGLHMPIVSTHEEKRGDGRKYKIVCKHHWSFTHTGGVDFETGFATPQGFPGIFNDHETTHAVHGQQMGGYQGAWNESIANYVPTFGFTNSSGAGGASGAIADHAHKYPAGGYNYYHYFFMFEHLEQDPEYGPLYMARMYQAGNDYLPSLLRDIDPNPATPFDDEWVKMAARNVRWDYPKHPGYDDYLAQEEIEVYRKHMTMLQEVPYLPAGWYEPPKWRAPQQHGYNLCPLVVPAGGTVVTAELDGFIDPDRGSYWRAMFVAVRNTGQARYGEVFSTDVPTNSFLVQASDLELYLVVSATPTNIMNIAIFGGYPGAYDAADYRKAAQMQFPYQVKLGNTSPRASKWNVQATPGPGGPHPNGGGFVAGTADVDSGAYVGPNAMVLDHAIVKPGTRIEDNAVVSGHARVNFGSIIRDNARVTDFARVRENMVVEGDARMMEHGVMQFQAKWMRGGAIVKGSTWFNAPLEGSAILDGSYQKSQYADKGYWFTCGQGINPGELDQAFDLLYCEYLFETQNVYRVHDTYGATWGRLVDGTNGGGDGIVNGPLYVSDSGPSTTSGVYALEFDGVDDLVDLHHSVAFKDSFSFEIDVKWDGGADDQRLLNFSSSTSGDAAWLTPRNSSGNLAFAITIGGTTHVAEATNSLPTGAWHQILVMSYLDSVVVHVDGSEWARSDTFTNDLEDVRANECYIGRGPAGNAFDGRIDNVRVWSKALLEDAPPTPDPAAFAMPPTQVDGSTVMMEALRAYDGNGPVQYYFEETTGNPGGTDSGWQTDPIYYDDGLDLNTLYTYVVRVRDSLTNTTADSTPASITTPYVSPSYYRMDENGWLVLEAEDYDHKETGTLYGNNWLFNNSEPGYSGIGGMKVDDAGRAILDDYAPDKSPRLDYLVEFTQPGSYLLRVRGVSYGGSSDSIHFGIDMQDVGVIVGIPKSEVETTYLWKTVQFEVTKSGTQWINIWMREDGTLIDRIMIEPANTPGSAPDINTPLSERPLSIMATINEGGWMSPLGNVAATSRTDQTFTITPVAGYQIADVRVDGVSVGNPASYTFTSVQNNHSIEVTMASTAPREMPFADGFDAADGYAPGDDLNGLAPLAHVDHTWIATGVAVTNNPTQAGGQSAALTGESAWTAQTFTEGETNVVTEMWVAPVFGIKHSSVRDVPEDASYAFYVNLDGQVVAFSNQTRVVLGAPGDVTNGVLTRFKVVTDYSAGTWDLDLHGTPLAAGLGFAGISPKTGYSVSTVRGAGDSTAVVDTVKVTVNVPDAIPPTVATYSPADDAINVPEAADLVLIFDERVRRGTGNITITNTAGGTHSVIPVSDGTQVSVVGSNATINPAANLLTGQDYAVLIDAGAIIDWADNPFAGIADSTTWNFTTGAADTNAPDPDPMTWASLPVAISPTAIRMVATTATDLNPVAYYFACVAGGGHDSGWQASPIYTDTGLTPQSSYSYTVKARDLSLALNETAPSDPFAEATTPPDPYKMPFYEPFEDRNVVTLDGQFGWEASEVMVQTNVTFAGAKAGSLTTSVANAVHTFTDGQTKVWTDMMLQPVFAPKPLRPRASASTAFYVSTNGHVMVYDGAVLTETAALVVEGEWTRFTVHSDHIAQTWDLFVDRALVASGLEFYSTSHSSYSRLRIKGAGDYWSLIATNSAYVDEITVGLTNTFTILADTNPPVVATYSPADDATNVHKAVDLVLTFYLPITNATGNITIKNLTDVSQTVISVTDTTQVSIVGTELTLNPATNLLWGKDYAVWIDAGAIEDLAGNSFAGIADDTRWNFTTTPPDLSPPSPDPMTFALVPTTLSPSSITMRASTASDPSGVEYYFACVAGGASDSGWQVSSIYTAPGLTHNTFYSYTVKARDLSEALNETTPSPAVGATTAFDTQRLPFYEPFDARAAGPLDGQYGWEALFVPTDVTVQTAVKSSGAHAARLSSGSATALHTFEGNDTDVWTEMMLQPVFAEETLTPASDASVAFYVASNGRVMVYNGPNLQQTALAVTEGEWTYFGVHSDHIARKWDLFVGTNAPLSGLNFYSPNHSRYTEFKVSGGGDYYASTTNPAYVDEIRIAFTNTLFVVDTNAPVVTLYSPADDSTDAIATNALVLTFNEPVQLGTIWWGKITIKNLSDGLETQIPIDDLTQLSVVGSNLMINPSTELLWEKDYAVQIHAGAILDMVANPFAGIADDTTWNFTTDSPQVAPTPDPMTWSATPYATSISSISMEADAATHWSGVEYYFDCVAGGASDSGWQAGRFYTVAGLTQNTTYRFTVKARGLNGLLATAPSVVASATTLRNPSEIPFEEPFDSRDAGPLDGQFGWAASNVTVQSAVTSFGSQAGMMTSGLAHASQTFNPGQTKVWTDMMLQPVFAEDQLTPDSDASVAFYVSTNGRVMVYDGAVLTETAADVVQGEWTRFSFYSDHISKTWNFYVDGSNVVTGLEFYAKDYASYAEFMISAAAAGRPADATNGAYMDQIYIGLTDPFTPDVASGTLFMFK